MDYRIEIKKVPFVIGGEVLRQDFEATYDPQFPHTESDKMISFKTNSFETLVEKISGQVKVAEEREDNLTIQLDDNDFRDSEKYRFFQAVNEFQDK